MSHSFLDTQERDEIALLNYCSPRTSAPNFKLVNNNPRASHDWRPTPMTEPTTIYETLEDFGKVNPILSSGDWKLEELKELEGRKISLVKRLKNFFFC